MRDPIDMLLDENNSDPITLYNEKDEAVDFEQVALIVLHGELFAILKPLGEYQGVGEDEALVFAFEEEDDERVLAVVEDDDTIDAVFEEYYAMLRKEGLL